MKKKRFTEEQIIGALKAHEGGEKVPELCRRLNIAQGTFYNWRAKYGGMEVSEARRLRELESENAKLNKILAEKVVEVEAMRDAMTKKW